MFDFANSSYTTAVMTTIFNTYFVNVVASGQGGPRAGLATLLWTTAVAVSNLLVVLSAPVLGAIADHSAAKKKLLGISTAACAVSTAMLAATHEGTVPLAMALIIIANFAYGTGENLIAAFLTEISSRQKMGRISALGLAIGYFGGPLVLTLCFVYIGWAQHHGETQVQFVPACMLMVAATYALAATPTFLWLRERIVAEPMPPGKGFVQLGFERLMHTIRQARKFEDLFRFLCTLVVYSCGTSAVIVLAAIYAQQVIGFSSRETVAMIFVVNVTAAAGAFAFGHIQDKIGSVRTLTITLSLWTLAIVLACFISSKLEFWMIALVIGIAMGSTQSTARALIGQFSPLKRSAEFFGLWGLSVKFASIVGPMTFGLISFISSGNQRLAILSTACFFIAGLALMTTVNEERGKAAALTGDSDS